MQQHSKNLSVSLVVFLRLGAWNGIITESEGLFGFLRTVETYFHLIFSEMFPISVFGI